MDSINIDGSHFGGVLRATARLLEMQKYEHIDVELICDEVECLYILQTKGENPVILSEFSC